MKPELEVKAAEADLENAVIEVGSEVYYIGSEYSMSRLCGVKKLTVQSIEDDEAEVQADGWFVTHHIPLTSLSLQNPSIL